MSVLRPGVRTYKPRRSRMSAREMAALSTHTRYLIQLEPEALDLNAIWHAPVVVEIGFGNGAATAAMAAANPTVGVLAIDVHTPGVARLLAAIDSAGLANVRVMEADALLVLDTMIPVASLSGVRSYFPDPWPKARHHKRRLVQPVVMELVGSRLRPGSSWHLATDWSEYAEQIQERFAADDRWIGGLIERPADRPVTHYERRALREGRQIVDLSYAWLGQSRTTVRSRPATFAS